MRAVLVLVAGFAGCRQGLPARVEPAWVDAVAAPAARSSVLDVAAAELGDDGALDRLRHRVRVKRIGRAWLSLGERPIGDPSGIGGGGGGGGGGDDDGPLDQVLPVIGETAHRIRVVADEDNARVAAWIDRGDAWESIVAPVGLDEARGPAGVWLEAGAPIAAGPKGRTRPITLRDAGVVVTGKVPSAFVGQVWLVPHDDHAPTDMTTCSGGAWQEPEDRRPRGWLAEDVTIRAATAEGARVLAALKEGQEVFEIARGGAWAEVELVRPFARIRGFVPASKLGESAGTFRGGLACGGRGFGMSHVDRIEVPAGTCLYDRPRGEIVGVALETQVRLGARGRQGDDWSMVHVDTRWSLASLYVRNVGRDPAQLVLESCTEGRHRR